MTNYTELKRLATRIVEVQTSQDVPISKLFDDFDAATSPEVVLALIAENEQLAKTADCWDRLNIQNKALSDSFRNERDQLKAENDQLFGETERLKAENERLQKLISWQGEGNNKVEVNAGPLMKHMDERDQLRAEVAGLRTSYEAYQQVNAELKAENELARMRIKEMDLLFGRYILAMRSALIEEEHGKGPAAAMQWIYNSLAGPGELPPEGETDSQAYFDREIVAVDDGMQEVMAFHDGRRAALGQGEQL